MLTLEDVVGGRYRLTTVLGHGGVSDVYAAVDQESGDSVAVKLIRNPDPEVSRRVAAEVRALEILDHPALVRLLDSGSAEGFAFIVMELVDGRTLSDLLRSGPMSPDRAAWLGHQLAGGLAYAHERGVVHRDVKPSNIIVDSAGDARLTDFGIARLLDDATLTAVGTTLGTAAYMAPEQLESHDVGPRADVWSLGVVLLECLTGRRVYEGSPSQVVARRLAGAVPIPPELPVPWKLLVGGMLDHRPEQRLDAAAVADLLATPPMRAPWEPAAPVDPNDATRALAFDLSGLSPDATRVFAGDDSTNNVGGARRPRRKPRRSWPGGDRTLIAGGIVLALVIGFLLRGAAAQSPTSSTTTAPPTTTTTVGAAPGPAAFARWSRDLSSAVLDASVPAPVAQTLSSQVSQVLVDLSGHNDSQASTDLQSAVSTVTSATTAGTVSATSGLTLLRDLGALATAYGLSIPTTTTGPPASPPPGHGHGHGNGNGNGD